MSNMKRRLREQLHVRPWVLGLCTAALGTFLLAPVFADRNVPQAVQYVALDDVGNRVVRNVESFPSAPTPPAAPAGTESAPPAADVPPPTGEPSGRSGDGNNGHGNNADGVDSSNPSQGHGGPNGRVDESCSGDGECVDDEVGGSADNGGDSNGRGNRRK